MATGLVARCPDGVTPPSGPARLLGELEGAIEAAGTRAPDIDGLPCRRCHRRIDRAPVVPAR